MLEVRSPICEEGLEGIYTSCQRCGAGCTVPPGEKFRDHLGERNIYCTNECRRQHGTERGFTLSSGFSNPIICEPPVDPDIILPMFTPRLRRTVRSSRGTRSLSRPALPSPAPIPSPRAPISAPRNRNLSRPNPKDIVWPALEMPKGGSGYGYPNVNWIHFVPDTRLYSYLIDSFRLRMQDIKARPITRLDIFYGDWNKDIAGFKHYLDLAEQTPGLLPLGWKSKRAACESLCNLDPYCDLSRLDTLYKSSIIMHHGSDSAFILRLRELAQAVFGYAPGNCSLDKL
ncbi:hypothetical protein CDV31_006664 [Fusarium ambrosium]|uniref:MYND-type zinc finger protein samB n=1 Tax=Fusarium ambrosium TaxID=131363 RepID=A0A428UB69_9HYPO|nr:hypothetical protein CDV31_006664 [Fusarium ambrosium]